MNAINFFTTPWEDQTQEALFDVAGWTQSNEDKSQYYKWYMGNQKIANNVKDLKEGDVIQLQHPNNTSFSWTNGEYTVVKIENNILTLKHAVRGESCIGILNSAIRISK